MITKLRTQAADRPLPIRWPFRTIESVCSRVTTGGTPSRKRPEFFENGTIPWFKTGELRDRLLHDSEEHITSEALESSSAKVFPVHTVLMAMYGDGDTITSLGVLCRPAATNQACCAMVVDPLVCDWRYLFYALKYTREALLRIVVGGAQRNLSGTIIRQHQVPLPPLLEQQAIASMLGALDDKIELNRRMNATLEGLARTIFQSWFVDFDPIEDEAPNDWINTTIGQIIESHGGEIQTGPFGSQLHASDYVEEGVPVVMPKQLSEDRISTEGISRIRETDAERLSKHRLQVGDIVQSRRGDVERLALVTGREAGWFCGTGCIRTRIEQSAVDPHFLFRYLSLPSVRSWIVAHALGSTMPNLNTEIIAAIPIALPADHQNDERLKLLKSAFGHRVKNDEESETLVAIRDTLLPKLLSGEIRVDQAEHLVKEAV